MIRKESKIADLIASSGLLGNNVCSRELQQEDLLPSEAGRQARPSSAPNSRRPSSSSSRHLSRANSRAAVILGLQATSSRRLGSDVGQDTPADSHEHSSGLSRNTTLRYNGSFKARPVEAWQDSIQEQQDNDPAALMYSLQAERQQQDYQLQELHQQLQKLSQQLSSSQTTQQGLELQLKQQQEQHHQAWSDLQAQHDNSSKKLFRELKAAEAAKEQALAGRRTAEHANRNLQQELATAQAQQQQLQQQLSLVEERLAAATKKLEQQARAHEEAKQRATAAAARQQEQLKEKLKAKEATIKEAEDSLRAELHKRTNTILGMQEELEGKGAALAAAAAHQQQLQGRLQELESQMLSPRAVSPPAAAADISLDIADEAAQSCTDDDGQQQQPQGLATQNTVHFGVQDDAAADGEHPSGPVLRRQLQLPAGGSPMSSSLDAVVAPRQVTARSGVPDGSAAINSSRSRPVSASAQMLRQSMLDIAAGGTASEAVKSLGAQVDGLTAALAAAKREMADIRQEYAQNLEQLESTTAAAEASAAACWEAYDITFNALAKRVSHLLQSHLEGRALPFHRPKSATAGAGSPWNVGVKDNPMFNARSRPASARPASAAARHSSPIKPLQQGDREDDPAVVGHQDASDIRPGSPSAQQRPQSANTAISSRLNTVGNGCNRPSSGTAGGSSSMQALAQLNQRLCEENAWLMVELSKWEAGHHQKQVAFAAATKEQERFGSIGSDGVFNRWGHYIGNLGFSGRDRSNDDVAVLSAATAEQGSTSNDSSNTRITSDDAGSSDQQGSSLQTPAGNKSMPEQQTNMLSDNSRSGPVGEAVKLAVKEALLARKGQVVPALLLQGLAAANSGGSSTSNGSGWAAAGSSRLVAALSAAEINMKLRTRVLQLESTVAAMQAEHAGDDSQSHQQQLRIQQLENTVDDLTAQLVEARSAADDAREKMQQSLAVAATAVAHQPHPRSSNHASGPAGTTAAAGGSSTSNSATAVPGIGQDEVLSCGGGGLLRDLPIAVQHEIAAQRRIAAAAKADKEARSRALTQLELRYSTLASKLVKARQAVANEDSQIAQLHQALAAAHNALLDAGVDLKQQGGALGQALAAAAAAGQQQQQQQGVAAGSIPAPSGEPAAGGGSSDGRLQVEPSDVMSMALSTELSDASVYSTASRLGGGASSVYSSAAAANAAAAASWTAAMEARERQRQIQRLTAESTDKRQKIDTLQQELRKLQQQLSKQQRASDAAMAALAAEENSRRQSLAGDLEGVTTAMQEATRKLTAREQQCVELQQQLAAALRRQQQLELDLSYLRSRRTTAVAAVAPVDEDGQGLVGGDGADATV